MGPSIEATFDGAVFRPLGPVPLGPNTLVRLTIEPLPSAPAKRACFLQTARALNLEGPPDWSANLHQYLRF